MSESLTTIKEFSEYIKFFSAQNNYDVMIHQPTMTLIENSDMKTMRMFARSVSVPSTSSTLSENMIMNQKKVALTTTIPDSIIITFFDTTTLFFHRLFNSWQYNRIEKSTNELKYYPDDYSTNIDIFNYGKKVYTLETCFPLSVGDFRFEDDSVNQYGTFDVTFHVNNIVFGKNGMSNG